MVIRNELTFPLLNSNSLGGPHQEFAHKYSNKVISPLSAPLPSCAGSENSRGLLSTTGSCGRAAFMLPQDHSDTCAARAYTTCHQEGMDDHQRLITELRQT